MTDWFVGTQAQCDAWRAQLDADAGCPLPSGATVGGPEWQHLLPADQRTPEGRHRYGTTHVVEEPVVESPGRAALRVPEREKARLGRGGLPQARDAVAADAIASAELRAKVYEREGKDEDGNLRPFREAGERPATKGDRQQTGAHPK